MFDEIRRWMATHPRWTLVLLVSAALAPFLAKPFNIDDPLFLWLARQVQAHPGDPFGFNVNWYGAVLPMWTVTENPPLAGYYYALAGSLFGWSEFAMHLAGLLATLGAVLGTHRLALNLCKQPVLAACAAFLTPVFLVSANTVMCDMLMLAFWTWAVVFWVEGLEQDRAGKIIVAGLFMALALLTKYFGVALLPLLAVHGAMSKRRLGPWVIGLLIPLAALGAYQWLTLALYRHALFTAAAGFATSVQGELGFSKLAGGLIALAFTGGAAANALFLAPVLWRPRTLAAITGGAAVLAGALGCSGHFLHQYSALPTPAIQAEVLLQLILWVVGGAFVMALAIADISMNPRDSRSWLLGLWVAGTFCFAGFLNWTVNGRSLLPLLPAVGILLARRWDAVGQKLPRWLIFGVVMSGLLGLLVAQSDFRLAVASRDSAEEAVARCSASQGTVWFEGHWGFQYYMEKLGAKAVDFKHLRQSPGDYLVLPQHNTDVSAPAPQIIGRRDVFSITNSPGLTTWQANVGAGFYSSVVGPLPFAFGAVPPETVYVFELKAPDAK
jgi:4-amino-4-deoxy-L-arabinose transferase-like glycosyltransferase